MDLRIKYDRCPIREGEIIEFTAEIPRPMSYGEVQYRWDDAGCGSWLKDPNRPDESTDNPLRGDLDTVHWIAPCAAGKCTIEVTAEADTGKMIAASAWDTFIDQATTESDFLVFKLSSGETVQAALNLRGPFGKYDGTPPKGAEAKDVVRIAIEDQGGLREFVIRRSSSGRSYRVFETHAGSVEVRVEPRPSAGGGGTPISASARLGAATASGVGTLPTLNVALKKTMAYGSVRALWAAIKERTDAIGFEKYSDFINDLFGGRKKTTEDRDPACARMDCDDYRRECDGDRERRIHLPHGVAGYDLLKTATQIFLLLECGIVIRGGRDHQGAHTKGGDIPERFWDPEDPNRPDTVEEAEGKLREYVQDVPGGWIEKIRRRFNYLPDGWLRLYRRESCPCMQELIWNYWMEEAGLVQALNAIGLRFQNRRYPGRKSDPLIEMEITPLRRINNLLWGHIQDEQHRLSVRRRAYEYDHHYGITLLGPAVPDVQPADSRSKFIEAFHYLLNHSYRFIQEQADKTVEPDPFPLLSDLREVHLLLSEGAHNQYGDLPWQSRVEFLMMQYLLHLPDMREFLHSRPMVNYPEAWMGPLDAMNRLQGWSNVTSVQYFYLAAYGERLLLSIRHNNWMDEDVDPEAARSWLQTWSQEIQGYIHAYRAVTGADLTQPDYVDTRMPAVLLRERRREESGRATAPLGPQTTRR